MDSGNILLKETVFDCVFRFVDAGHQLVDANSIVTQMSLKIRVVFPNYLLTYIDEHCVQHEGRCSTS